VAADQVQAVEPRCATASITASQKSSKARPPAFRVPANEER